MLRLSEQRRIADRFFRAEIRNFESATTSVVQGQARALKRIGLAQLKRFRKGPNSTGGFHKAVKVYDLEARGSRGPASYTRFGVPFVGIWQEGSAITGKPNLVILTRQGETLGFRRISKGNPWSQVWSRIAGKSRTIPVRGGKLVLVRHQGKEVPVYYITQQVKEPKLLSIYEEAQKLSANMPDQLIQLME